MPNAFTSYCSRVSNNFSALADLAPEVRRAADLLVSSLETGGEVLFCGNGGSAADSQHLAAELMGRYLCDRGPLPALALTVDTSALTAIGNDYGYREVFARQLRGVGRRGDVLVAISTSGNSDNVLDAIGAAREVGIAVIGLTGANGGRMASGCNVIIKVPSTQTDHVQEMHIAMGHYLCGVIEKAAFQE